MGSEYGTYISVHPELLLQETYLLTTCPKSIVPRYLDLHFVTYFLCVEFSRIKKKSECMINIFGR